MRYAVSCATRLRTLGVDLAKASATTAMCIVQREPDRTVVEAVRVDVDDAANA